MESAFRTRFAPSPTGYLHAGHGYSARLAFEMARAAHGHFLLRIEDIDHTRCTSAFEQAIIEDLNWLGIAWDAPPVRQSDRLALYQAALARLQKMGVLYRCFKTRKDLTDLAAPHGAVTAFTGRPDADEATKLARGEPFAWRLSLARCCDVLGACYGSLCFIDKGVEIHAQPDVLGDVILARKDTGVAYHLAVVVDDAAQAITHVIRGCDLFDSTHIHVLLQALLDLPTPVYHHHKLITDKTGVRLAKRHGSESLRDLRERGVTVDALRAEWALSLTDQSR